MLDVQCSMFNVHFLVNPSCETTPKWHGCLTITPAALAAVLNSEPQNIEYRISKCGIAALHLFIKIDRIQAFCCQVEPCSLRSAGLLLLIFTFKSKILINI